MEANELQALWSRIHERVNSAKPLTSLEHAFFGMVYLTGVTNEQVHLCVSDAKQVGNVKSRLLGMLGEAFAKELQRDVEITISVDASLMNAEPSIPSQHEAVSSFDGESHKTVYLASMEHRSQLAGTPAFHGVEPARDSVAPLTTGDAPPEVSPRRRDKEARRETEPAHLNHRYTFESFVTGASNRLASSAARAVSENPASAYNPLFIYGQSGLGKTHLLHAIGLYALNLDPNYRVRYVNSEEFTNEFINSIRDDSFQKFQQKYRDADFLLVDDIQFLSNKEETQEAFFHTFNALHQHNKQVVITSDLPPMKLTGFEDRMKSRFEWGLITDVQPPNLETRIAILRMKAAADRIEVEPEVLNYIAERVSNNIRNLEGALTRVAAANSLSGKQVDLQQIEHILRDIVSGTEAAEVTVPAIIAQTSAYYNVSVEALTGTSRSRKLVDARQVAMYISRELTELSLPKIGAEFGNRDHTTVIHAVKKISDRIKSEQRIFDEISELTGLIKNRR